MGWLSVPVFSSGARHPLRLSNSPAFSFPFGTSLLRTLLLHSGLGHQAELGGGWVRKLGIRLIPRDAATLDGAPAVGLAVLHSEDRSPVNASRQFLLNQK